MTTRRTSTPLADTPLASPPQPGGRSPKAPPNRLRTARVAAGLTQAELAKKVQCASWTISRLERGVQKPHHLTAKRIAKVLRKSLRRLFPHGFVGG